MEYFCDRYITFGIAIFFFFMFGIGAAFFRIITLVSGDEIKGNIAFWVNLVMFIGFIATLILIFFPSHNYICGVLKCS